MTSGANYTKRLSTPQVWERKRTTNMLPTTDKGNVDIIEGVNDRTPKLHIKTL